ncbi:hypothetical protein BM221_001136 [Beauveria bassiana]|uniref:Uncharacterized protein n=1 Tax=Beauveria bassiana TaxID=176275 RepID=A0A2N6P2F7_BEABA|nr:hypothetical protein BM221_001136 [Beauveria bassiana]
MRSIDMGKTSTEDVEMRFGDAELEKWQRNFDLNETRMGLQLQQIIANLDTSLTKLQTMISGDYESVAEFLSRYKRLHASDIT